MACFTNLVEFDTVPSPLTVAVEEGMATFYCQHSACDIIDWRVNGSSLNRLRSTMIVFSRSNSQAGDAQVYSLSIGTLLEYNMTRVECVAIFFDGSPPQFTSLVTLLIQGVYILASNQAAPSFSMLHAGDEAMCILYDIIA